MSIYYVYQYLRSDGTPYYIGKGMGRRAFSANHSINVPKDRTRIIMIKENMLESDAFALEIKLIAKYGRKDIGTGILRNMTNGGEGSSGFIFSDESRVKRSTSRKEHNIKNPITQETRDKMSASAKKRFNNPEERAKTAAAQKLLWDDPLYLIKQSAAISAAQNREEVKVKHSTAQKKYRFENPDKGKEHSAFLKVYYAKNPITEETRIKRSASMKEYWKAKNKLNRVI
jgi:DNA-binding cell septation regulator SpoVG